MDVRGLYRWFEIGAILAAAAAIAAGGVNFFAARRPSDGLVLVAACLFAAIQGWLRAPAAMFERSPHPQPKADRVALLLPLLVWTFALEGWWAAAIVNAVSQLVRPTGQRRMPIVDRLGSASLRIIVWWWLGHFASAINERGPLMFLALNAAWYFAANIALLDPLLSVRTGRRLGAVWRARLRDGASLVQLAAELFWALLAVEIARRAGMWFGLAALLPLIIVSSLALSLARVRARLHRATLTRSAVEAMLSAADPLPQIRQLLGSIEPRLVRESLEVYAFSDVRHSWTRIARLGAVAPTALRGVGATALDALTMIDDGVGTQRGADGSAYSYAVRDDGCLVGAILVYRPAESAGAIPHVELQHAAQELGHVLGDYTTIEATRSAAAFDALTGLANRRTVGRAVDDAMDHVRAGGSYAVLLLDLDHFKSINDFLGHQEGDRVLAGIGRIMAENVREGDLAGRFGGEEFIILLRDASRERALGVAERLRTAIAASGLRYADGAPLTVSVGVAYARPDELSRDCIERADKALYRAKNAGRNRVVESAIVA